jgi:hypothetical protein
VIFLSGRCSKATVEIGSWMLRADMAGMSPQVLESLLCHRGTERVSRMVAVAYHPWDGLSHFIADPVDKIWSNPEIEAATQGAARLLPR